MELLVLRKNDEYMEMSDKLKEETDELRKEIEMHIKENKDNKENIAAEALDVIQVCIGILDRLEQEEVDIKDAAFKHNMKLINRNWRIKNILHIFKN